MPRLLAAVDVNLAPPEVADNEFFHIKGILLRYIDGFTLRDLADNAPRSAWQEIIDQAVAASYVMGYSNILDEDRHMDNVMISPKGDGSYDVFMIDFGHSRLRCKDVSEVEWATEKYQHD